MEGRTFGTIFSLILLAAALAAWQHFQATGSQKADMRDVRTLILNVKTRIDRKKADLEAAQAKLTVMQAVVGFDQEKKTLTAEISQLEADRAAAQKKLDDTLERVRTAAVGVDWADVALPNGQVITGVKIQKSTSSDVALSHSSGVVKIPAKDLPDDLKARLGFGLDLVAGP